MQTATFSIFEETVLWLKKNNTIFCAEDEMASTNDLAKKEAFAISSTFKVYLTDHQTRGRGRGNNTWLSSEKGHQLLATFSFALSTPPQPILPARLGLKVYQVLSSHFADKKWSLKAPNDVYLENKKICGLLIETVTMGEASRLIIGVGLNVFSSPSDVPSAGHLAENGPLTRDQWAFFLKDLLKAIHSLAMDSSEASLSNQERQNLLEALNLYPGLKSRYISVSPFADLMNENNETTSWRNL